MMTDPNTTPTKPPNQITEDMLLRAVIEMAQRLGWMAHHARPAPTRSGGYATPIAGNRGFPDLVLARAGVVLFVELKSESGRYGLGQVAWANAIDPPDRTPEDTDQVRYYLWRPSDWLDGTIAMTLRTS